MYHTIKNMVLPLWQNTASVAQPLTACQDTKSPISDSMTFLLCQGINSVEGGGLLEHYYQGCFNHLLLEKILLPANSCHGS